MLLKVKRTTLPIAPSLLKAIKEIARQEGVAMRKVISDLIEMGLQIKRQKGDSKKKKSWVWHTQAMEAKVDLEDKDQVIVTLDSKK